jgi:N-acetylmuramoyl-L-alanine amidase
MSANPTRVEWDPNTATEAATPLQEGNRVLESIARQEALRSLLAFSDLHEQIRNRRTAQGSTSDSDLFETERFILDEVLQLICDRTQAVTKADGILIALTDEAEAGHLGLVVRASAGPLAVERGVRLISQSEFLQDALDSGRILRCDDCEIDTRVELDFARAIGSRSTVLVPLRGRYEQLGVLQAFSTNAWAFSDHDIRSFDLLAELVLTALKPEDQNRRLRWLAEVCDEVLQSKPAVSVSIAVPAHGVTATKAPAVPSFAVAPSRTSAAPFDPPSVAVPIALPILPTVAAAPVVALDLKADAWTQPVFTPIARVEPTECLPTAFELSTELSIEISKELANGHSTEPSAAASPELSTELSPELSTTKAMEPVVNTDADSDPVVFDIADGSVAIEESVTPPFLVRARVLPFLRRLPVPLSTGSRTGLRVVLGAVAVAALFSAGVWWGMQLHGKTAMAKTEIAKAGAVRSPQSVTAPPAPPSEALVPVVADTASDNLMSAAQPGSGDAPLTPVPANKLAALPKITGVRHWSSSTGSTVVVDMEDNVPYEVHRLMSPERIYFDLHDTVLPTELEGKTMDVGDAALTRVRVAQPVAGITRIVLDTKDGSNFSVSMESSPYRLVVELRGSDKTSPASHTASRLIPNHAPAAVNAAPLLAPAVADAAAKIANQSLQAKSFPAKTGKFRIVLDAGHGGWDLGTVGRQGLLEKDLVLDVTQRLGKLLQARLGSEIVFTRSGDSYLPLDQRADLANQAQADLFVSVHANYSNSAAARGVETYFTNIFSAPGSKETDKHDDGTAVKLTPVSLSAGGLHEKIRESQRLAASVQRSLYATLAASSPDIRNRGIKDSAFAVLTGTTMPAILTEISFVSSPADELKLQSASYRQQIAEALYQGIARYQQSSPRTKVAQLQTAARR